MESPPTPKNEPVIWAGALAMLVGIVAPWLAKHGLTINAEALTAVLTPIVAWAASAYWARKNVHPNAKVAKKVAAALAEGVAIGAARGPS